MGLNCTEGPTAEPDGTCDSCRAIMNSSSMDVLEMDAASNRGIDEIRELRDRVNLAPASGRMKVYIIDEVHMLTAEAFNALLKMLEEPPEHVIFVLATTEKHKVLPTIISRCQSFDFRRPGVGTLSEKLAEIAEAEGIETEPEALTIIAREGKGSFRDAEGLLDQLSSFADGPITAPMVRELLGSVGSEAMLETTAALYERRVAEALKVVDRLSNEGRDLAQFVGELIRHLRVLMLLPHAPEVALAEVGADERAALEEQAAAIPAAEVVRMLEALGDTSGRIKRGGDTKLELELTFLKLGRDYTEPSVEKLMSRLEALESAAASGGISTSPPRITTATASNAETVEMPESEETPEEDALDLVAEESSSPAESADKPPEKAPEEEFEEETTERTEGPVTTEELAAAWASLMVDMKNQRQVPAAAVYEGASVEGFDGKLLRLAYPEDMATYAKLAGDERHVGALQSALQRRFGIKPRLECRVGGESDSSAEASQAPAADAHPEPSRREPAGEPEMDRTPDPETPPESVALGQDVDEAVSREAAEDEMETTSGEEPPESRDGDDTIGSVQEVLDIARDRFGSSNDNGGG
jgi:DNA polymerase-3 subunit gamma/tau